MTVRHSSARVLARRVFHLSAATAAVLGTLSAPAADVAWTGAGGSSFWDVLTNWSTGARPAAADDVTIGAVPLVQIRSASGFTGAVARSIDADAAEVLLSASSLVLSAPSSFHNLRQTGGTLTSTSSLSLANSTWTSGVQNGAGTTTLLAGGTHIWNGAGGWVDGGRVLRNEGTLDLVSGTGSWSADLNFTPGTPQAGAGRIENAGTLNVAPVINRVVSFVATNGGTGDTGADATFTNSGTLHKTGAGTLNFGVHLINTGTIDVDFEPGLEIYGGLQMSRGGSFESGSLLTGTGRVFVSSPAANPVVFKSGSSTTVATFNAFNTGGLTNIEAGANFTPGLLNITGNIVTVAAGANFAPGALEMSGGTLDLTTNDLSLPDGSVLSGQIKGTGTVFVDGAIVRGPTFKDAGTFVFTGDTRVGNGTAASLGADGGRVLRNTGTMTFDLGAGGGNFTADLNTSLNGAQAGSGRLENQGAVVFNTYLNRSLTFSASNLGGADTGSSARIDNTGTMTQNGPGTVVMNTLFNNSGTYTLNDGTLNVYLGALDNKAGGNLQGNGLLYLQYLNTTPHYLRSGSTLRVSNIQVWGDVRIEDNATFAGDYIFVRTVVGSQVTKLGSQSFVWNDGQLDVQSKVIVQQNVPMLLRGGRLGGSGTIEMIGAATATAPTLIAENGTVAPGGSFGYATGADVSAATFSITGDYEQRRPATLEIDLFYVGGALTNPVVQADKLAVSGDATLGGILLVELGSNLNPQYMLGRQYTVLTSSRLFGTFDVIASAGNWGGYGFAVDYVDGADADTFADQVRITINGTPVPPPPPPIPEPGTWALMLAGVGLLAARARRR